MNILIVENEIYLAQSIESKLNDLGHHCDLISSANETDMNQVYDAILLSTDINEHDFLSVIARYESSIIILMVSYINNDTVLKPMELGADDYIQKPFVVELLINKINHFRDYKKAKDSVKTLNNYFEYNFLSMYEDLSYSYKLPLLVKSTQQKNASFYAFSYSKESKKELEFVSLIKKSYMNKINNISLNTVIYLTDFQILKDAEKEALIKNIKDKNVILSTTNIDEKLEGFSEVTLESSDSSFSDGDILSIEDYVKYIIKTYQDVHPDTELSKKLGISRKSLWEKRKKYGIIKNAKK